MCKAVLISNLLSMNFQHILIVFSFLGFTQSLTAQTPLSLQDAIGRGLDANYQIKIREKEMYIDQLSNSWARAGRVPTIILNGNLPQNLSRNNNPASFLNGTFYQASAGADISIIYPLLTGGRVDATKRQQDLNESQSFINKDLATLETKRNIKNAYYNVLIINQSINIIAESIKLSKDRLEYGKAGLEYGKLRGIDVRTLQDAVFADSIRLIQQNRAYANAMVQLKNTMNDTSVERYVLTDGLSQNIALLDPKSLKVALTTNNLNLQQLLVNRKIAEANTEIIAAALKPTLNLGFGIGAQENANKFIGINPRTGTEVPLTFGNVINSNIALTFQYTLYDGMVNKKNVQIGKIREDVAAIIYDQSALILSNQLQTFINDYNFALSQYQVAEKQITNATTNLNEAKERFSLSQITSFDYRTVQITVQNAELNRLSILQSMNNTLNEIELLTTTDLR